MRSPDQEMLWKLRAEMGAAPHWQLDDIGLYETFQELKRYLDKAENFVPLPTQHDPVLQTVGWWKSAPQTLLAARNSVQLVMPHSDSVNEAPVAPEPSEHDPLTPGDRRIREELRAHLRLEAGLDEYNDDTFGLEAG